MINVIPSLSTIFQFNGGGQLSWLRKLYIFLIGVGRGAVVAVIVRWLDLQLPVQSVPITTYIMSLNLAHGEVNSIQHYATKSVSDLQQDGG